MNRQEKRIALQSALTNKVVENKLIVVDELKMDEVKTKKFAEVIANLKAEKALVVLEGENKNVVLSARNIADVKTAGVNELNVYDVMNAKTLVVTKAAVKNIEEVYA